MKQSHDQQKPGRQKLESNHREGFDAVVFIVDDDADFRESLSWLLEGEGYNTRCFASAEAFLEGYDNTPGCLLLDLRMTGMSGLALQARIQERGWVIPVIMITGHGDVDVAVQAMKNHAVDFIEKPFDDESIIKLVNDTLVHSRQLFRDAQQAQAVSDRWHSLSKRETEVATLVVGGMSNREISEELGISIKTVEIHRSRVMSKMQVSRLADLMTQVGGLKLI